MSDGSELALTDPDAPKGSPGDHYTAATVKAYDPSGLRSAMTATHAEMYKSIQAHMPNHNVRNAWTTASGEKMDKVKAAVAEMAEAGLPVVPGYNIAGVTQDAPIVVGDYKKSTW